jgi:hypothetical protein
MFVEAECPGIGIDYTVEVGDADFSDMEARV